MTESKWPITWDARWIWAGPAPLPVSPIGAPGIPPKKPGIDSVTCVAPFNSTRYPHQFPHE